MSRQDYGAKWFTYFQIIAFNETKTVKCAHFEKNLVYIASNSLQCWLFLTLNLNYVLLLYGKSPSQPSPSGPSRHRNAIVRPAVKPPPVPAYAVKQKEQTSHPHAEPAAGSSSQSSPQGHTSSACKPPPLLPGPTCLLPQIPKNQPSSGTKKLRPDPPRRPPPHCPAIKGV